MSERTLALAGVFQATELVRQAASHGTWSGYAAKTCLHSLFALESQSVDEIYGGKAQLRLGTETLATVLRGDKNQMDSLRYAIGLLQIERKFSKKRAMQQQVGETLEQAQQQFTELEEHEREDQQAQMIAELYSKTISELSPRIVVHGNPRYLQNERTVNWIRTLLFCGLRSAVLWSQLGGSRWNLMFGRKQVLADADQLLGG